MAVIQPYNDNVLPQGGLNVQANPNAFGANVGAAIQNVGNAVSDYSETLYRNEVQNDVTNVHVELAKKRAEWQQKLTQMANETQPGDNTFVPRVMDAMQKDFDAMSQSLKTKPGQQTFARMTADMTSMFGQEAIGIQSRLDGEFAKNQYKDMSSSLGSVAAGDHTQVKSLVAQGLAAIDDPNGRFARVPEPTREAFRKAIKEEIEYDAAVGFARRYPNAVLGTTPPELQEAVKKIAAEQPRPGLPPDLKASYVKPYDQKLIDSKVKQIDAPSPYDQTFKDAAALRNLDWRELKMRAVVESSLNPNADSGKAQGIMQFAPETAKQLGVNPKDPKASIFAAAKLLSEYRTKAGGDMAQVDRMYYGGESGKAWGPNTQQYAANLSALRQAAGLGTQVPPEAFAPSPTTQVAQSQDWKKARTGIDFIDNLPADKFFNVLTQAEHYQRAYETQSERARVEAERQKRDQQEAVMNQMTQRIINPNSENGGALNEIEIASHPLLTSTQKQHMIGYITQWTNYKQDARRVKTDPETYNDLYRRINAPDDDPSKIFDPSILYDALKNGKISPPDHGRLMTDLRALKDGSGGGFQRDLNTMMSHVNRELSANTVVQAMAMTNPGLISDISYRFQRDLEQQIDQMRKENKDPRTLLDPDSRDYALKPGRLQKYISPDALAEGAAKVASTEAKTLPTYKDYDSLPKGAQFTDPQGNVRVKP